MWVLAADIPGTLYSVINEIGKDKIRQDVISDIHASEKYSRQIMQDAQHLLGVSDAVSLGTLCEALLHFMLTVSVLPSQRKLSIKGIEVDIVVPTSRILLHDADKALVIPIIKLVSDASKVRGAETLQPVKDNIWIVSADRFQTHHRSYNLEDNSYYGLVRDIHGFVSSKGISGLKLLH